MFIEKIQGLRAFPQEMIYHFVAETPEHHGQHTFENYYVPSFLQFSDVLNTYLYLQNTLLPSLNREDLAALAPEKWQEILCHIHQLMMGSLSKYQHIASGQYRDGGLVVFRRDQEELQYILMFLEKKIPWKKSKFFEWMAAKFKQPQCFYEDFLALLQSMQDREDIQLAPSSQALVAGEDPNTRWVSILLERLYTAYLTHQLSIKQKKTIEALMIPCVSPEEIHAKMLDFFHTLSQRFATLDRQDSHAVAALMADIFQKVITIHPFANGNGRTVMCFINFLLKQCDYPSICFYYGKEKNDVHSDYGIATQQIFSTTKPMVELILKRLSEKIPHPAEEFEKTRIYIHLSEFLVKKHLENPQISIDRIFLHANRIARAELNMPQHVQLDLDDSLRIFKLIPSFNFEPPRESIFSPVSSSPEIAVRLNQIYPASAVWKFYIKKQCALLVCKTPEEAKAIAQKINAEGLMTASVSMIKDSKEPVVQVQDIQKEALFAHCNRLKS